MKIISKEWCTEQACDLYTFIAAESEISNLPTEGIAYGSSCICDDGKLYFLFEGSDGGEWKAFEEGD